METALQKAARENLTFLYSNDPKNPGGVAANKWFAEVHDPEPLSDFQRMVETDLLWLDWCMSPSTTENLIMQPPMPLTKADVEFQLYCHPRLHGLPCMRRPVWVDKFDRMTRSRLK